MVNISFEKITLSNGLEVILHRDHSIPLAAVNVWYHVGSKDEEIGRTGFAHLFEHVMFEGSKNHNRSYFEPLQKAGANLNGSTTPDRTNYWEDVPSNYLELALWLESDRMGFLMEALDQKRFDIQRDVVKNERRQTYENRPYGMAYWRLQEAVFPMPHPYHWMTIGSQEDLDAASLDDVKDFFRRFYSPSNASLAIAGHFQRDQTLDLINRYFGDLPPGPALPRKGRFDSGLAGRVELEMRDKVSLPRLYIAWATPPDLSAADAPLEFLQAILSDGITSRLHRSLVYEKQIAQSALIRYHPSEIAGQFVIQVTAAAGHDLAEVEAATDAEVERLWREPPTGEEITRIKNRISAAHFRQLARIGGFGGRADQLNHFNTFGGDPGLINSILDRYLAVQREDILRVGQAVLNHRQVRLRVLPEDSFQPAVTPVAVNRASMPQPAEEPSFTPPKPSHLRLENGLKITVIEQPRLPIVSFGLMIRAGAAADPVEFPGLASFTAQLLAEGTSSRSSQEIAAAFEFLGARISIEVGREHTLLATETMSKDWPSALELMADLVKHPTFPDHELERVRREELTDLRRSKDDPAATAERLVSGLMFDQGSGYGHPIRGTEAALGSLSRDNVTSHFRRAFSPASAMLIVAGDVNLADVRARAEAALGDWRAGSDAGVSPAPTSDGKAAAAAIYLVDRPGAAQSVIWALQTTIPRHHSDYFGLVLLNSAFGGQFEARLNLNLRQEKGYSYGYHSYVQWHRGPSLLLAGGSVHTAVTKESVAETLREFNEVHSERPISQKELEEARAGMLRAYPASFERPGQVLGHLIQLTLYDLPDDYFQTVRSRVKEVSLAEVQRIGAERIFPDQLKVLVVGDREAVEAGLRELGLPVVLLDENGAEL
jgi:zinc protease